MSEQRLEVLRRMAESRPEDPRLLFGLAVELLKVGKLEEGAETLRAYLGVAEDEGNGWARLGAALAELGEIAEAREAYSKGIAIGTRRGHDAMVEEMREALEDLS